MFFSVNYHTHPFKACIVVLDEDFARVLTCFNHQKSLLGVIDKAYGWLMVIFFDPGIYPAKKAEDDHP